MNSWREQALAHWEMINRMAGRRFVQAELAEEAALYVMDGLAQDDWSRLRAFTGRSTLATYIGALTLRLLEDFARTRFGRVKPPLWIRRLGGIWMTLFRLLCLERFSPDEAVATDRQPATRPGSRRPKRRPTASSASCPPAANIGANRPNSTRKPPAGLGGRVFHPGTTTGTGGASAAVYPSGPVPL